MIIQHGTGLYASGKKDSDIKYLAPNLTLPKNYKIGNQLSIYDQGSIGSCVSVTVMEMYYNYLTQKNSIERFPNTRTYLFNKREDMKVDGMTPRNAFEILIREDRIKNFAFIGGVQGLKVSVLTNGSALIGLPVKSFNNDFWNGSGKHGAHAVAVVGWNPEGLVIKNSWGKAYGHGGYYNLPYEDFNLITECWTIMI